MTTLSRLAVAVVLCGFAAGVTGGLTASLPIDVSPGVSEPLASTVGAWLLSSAVATFILAPALLALERLLGAVPPVLAAIGFGLTPPLLMVLGPTPLKVSRLQALWVNLNLWVERPGFFLVQIFPYVVGGVVFGILATRPSVQKRGAAQRPA